MKPTFRSQYYPETGIVKFEAELNLTGPHNQESFYRYIHASFAKHTLLETVWFLEQKIYQRKFFVPSLNELHLITRTLYNWIRSKPLSTLNYQEITCELEGLEHHFEDTEFSEDYKSIIDLTHTAGFRNINL